MIKNTILICAALALSGCATIAHGTTQDITVSSAPATGIKCTLTNGAGTWEVITPATVTIKKSGTPLKVRCDKSGESHGSHDVDAKLDKATVGNAVGGMIGATVGASIDAATGALHNYNGTVTFKMEPTK